MGVEVEQKFDNIRQSEEDSQRKQACELRETCNNVSHFRNYAQLSQSGTEEETGATGKGWVMKGYVDEMKEFGFYPERYVYREIHHPRRKTTKKQQKQKVEVVVVVEVGKEMGSSTFTNVQASVVSDQL